MSFLHKHIKQLLDQDVSEHTSSQYSSPMFLVPKPDHPYRVIVDYHHLNQCNDAESVPLLDIHSAFNWFGKAKYFITLDLNHTYTQIPVFEKPESQLKMAVFWVVAPCRLV
jgi:hypothetical protein